MSLERRNLVAGIVSKKWAVLGIAVVVCVVVIAQLLIYVPWKSGQPEDYEFPPTDQPQPQPKKEARITLEAHVGDGSWSRDQRSLPQVRFEVEIQIANVGNAASKPITVRVYEGAAMRSEQTIAPLPPGRSEYLGYTHYPIQYDHQTSVRIEVSPPYPLTQTLLLDATLPRSTWDMTDRDMLRLFVTPDDPEVAQVAKQILDNRLFIVPRWICLRDWVGSHIDYIPDYDKHRTSEYYQLPRETLRDGTGDCEDFSMLLVSLFRAAGWSSSSDDRAVYVVFGKHRDAGPREPGHAWVGVEVDLFGWQMIEPNADFLESFATDLLWLPGFEPDCYFNDQYLMSAG